MKKIEMSLRTLVTFLWPSDSTKKPSKSLRDIKIDVGAFSKVR
ncbi:hypothetical protein [Marinoscillum sp. MHG1-6]|nr:hypothetical protein [Marinoscillum sp. MHG1-6]